MIRGHCLKKIKNILSYLSMQLTTGLRPSIHSKALPITALIYDLAFSYLDVLN
jgi:hypothetical protein